MVTLVGVPVVLGTSGCSCGSTAAAEASTTCSSGGSGGGGGGGGGGAGAPDDGPQCELDLSDLAVLHQHVVARMAETDCDIPAEATVTLTIDFVPAGTNPQAPVPRGHAQKSGPTPIPAFNATADCAPGSFTATATITGEGTNGAPIVQGAPESTDPMTISSWALCE